MVLAVGLTQKCLKPAFFLMATNGVGNERVGVGILVFARLLVLYTLSLLENIPRIWPPETFSWLIYGLSHSFWVILNNFVNSKIQKEDYQGYGHWLKSCQSQVLSLWPHPLIILQWQFHSQICYSFVTSGLRTPASQGFKTGVHKLMGYITATTIFYTFQTKCLPRERDIS